MTSTRQNSILRAAIALLAIFALITTAHAQLAANGTPGDRAVYELGSNLGTIDDVTALPSGTHTWDFDAAGIAIADNNDSFELGADGGGDDTKLFLTAGHHIVIFGGRWDAANERSNPVNYLKLNGTAIPYGQASGYTRDGGSTETFLRGGTIINVGQGDHLEVESERTDIYQVNEARTITQVDGDLQLIKLDDANLDFLRLRRSTSTSVLAASSSGPTDIAYEVQDEIDTASFGHSTSSDSEQITLKGAGHYLVFANTGFSISPTAHRNAITQQLKLNGSAIPGGASQVYLRNSNANDTAGGLNSIGAASVGVIIEVTNPNSILTVEVTRDNTGSTSVVSVDPNRTGLAIAKLPSYGDYISLEGAAQDVNTVSATARDFSASSDVSNGSFTYASGTSASQVVVNTTDDVLFLGSYYAPAGPTRSVVNTAFSTTSGGAVTYGSGSSYGRNDTDSPDQARANGNWSGVILSGLSINDGVEVTTQRFNVAGAVNGVPAVQALNITSISTAPPIPIIGVNAGLNLTVNETFVITPFQLSTGDADNTAAELTYTVDTVPSGGTLRLSTVALTSGSTFTQDDIDTNKVDFVAQGTATPSGSFDFTVRDPGLSFASGTFTINVVDAIVVNNDTGSTDEDSIATVVDGANASVLHDDTGDAITVTSFDLLSANGAAINVNSDGTFSYDPGNSIANFQALASGGSVTGDTFTYTVTDSIGKTAIGTVTFSVTGIDDALGGAADDDGGSTNENVNLTTDLAVLDNDGIVHLDSGGNELILNYDASTSAGTGRWENTGDRSGTNADWILTDISRNTSPGSSRTKISASYDWDNAADLAAFAVGRGIHDTVAGDPDGGDATWEYWVKPASGWDSAVMTIFETGGSTGFGVVLDNGRVIAATEFDGITETGSAVTYDLVNDPLNVIAGVAGAGQVEADFQQIAVSINDESSGGANDGGLVLYINGVKVDESVGGVAEDWDGGDDSGLGIFRGDNHGGFQGTATGTTYDAPFLGSMAIVRLYDGILTPAQVLQNFVFVDAGTDVEGDAITVQGVLDSVSALKTAGQPATLASGGVVTMNTSSPFNFTYNPTGIPNIADLLDGESFVDTFTYQIGSAGGTTATAEVTVTVLGVNQTNDDTIAATELVVTSYTANRIVGNDDHARGASTPFIRLNANEATAGNVRVNFDTGSVSLAYDTELGDFTVGQVVTGTTSTAVGTITSIIDNGTDGILNLSAVTGTFADDEQITDPVTGDALVNGTSGTAAFAVGQILTGASSAATGIIEEVNGTTSGSLILNTVSGIFTNNEQITDPLGGDALANGVSFVVWENEGTGGNNYDVTIDSGTLKSAAADEVVSNFGAIGAAFEDIGGRLRDIQGLPSTNDATIEIWFKPDPTGTGKQLLFETGGSGTGTSLAYNNSNGIVTFKSDGGTDTDLNVQLQVDASGINKNEFNQLVAVYDRDNPGSEDSLTLYVNSDPTSFNGTPNAVSTPGPTGVNDISGTDDSGIGAVNNSAALNEQASFVPFDGQIAIVRIYARKLTVAEIEENFDVVAQPITQFTGNGAPGPIVVTSTLGATVTLNADGSFDYDASSLTSDIADGIVVQDTFTYSIDDGEGGTATSTVTVDVTGVGSFLAVNDDVTILEGGIATAYDPAANDQGAGSVDVEIQSVVSSFSGNIPTGTVNGEAADFLDGSGHGWEFLWNAPTGWTQGGVFDSTTGALGSVADYDQLVWDDTLQGWFVDADGLEDDATSEPGSYLQLMPDQSGINGLGSAQATGGNDKDRCLILAYTVDSDGNYGIADSTISIGASTDGITIETYVGSTSKTSTLISPSTTGSFDENLGALTTGDTIYIAICPNGTRGTDWFTGLDFNLVKLPLDTSPIETASLGTFTTDGSTITYDPSGAFENLAVGESVFESITYTIFDTGSSDVSTATFTVEIQGENDAPVTVADTGFTTDEDTVLTVTPATSGLASNDTDIDTGETLSTGVFEVLAFGGTPTGTIDTGVGTPVTTEQGGSVTVAADGTFVYDPTGSATLQALSPGDSLDDRFDYVAKDTHDLTAANQATVTITVTGAEDGVIASADDFGVNVGTTLAGNLIADDNGNGADSTIDTGDDLSIQSIDLTGTQGIVSGAIGQVIGTHGTVSLDIVGAPSTPTTVNYGLTTLSNPVVIARPISENGVDTTAVRISNVNAAAGTFDIRMVEMPGLDGDHPSENISWVVLDAGQYQLSNGAFVEVGSVSTAAIQHDGTGGTSWESVVFASTFSTTPVVLNCLQTEDGGVENDELFSTRSQGVSLTGFDVALEDHEGDTEARTVPETIGWVAIEPGTGGTGSGPFEVGSTGLAVSQAFFTINFAETYATTPDFIASMMTIGGADPSNVRYRTLGSSSVQVRSAEDTVFEAEITHAAEDIGYLVLGGSGSIYGYPQGGTAGAFTYEAAGSLVGLANGATAVDTFTYTLTDSRGNTSTETVSITVTGSNVAPETAESLDQTIIDGASPVSLGDIVAADRNGFSGITTPLGKGVDFPDADSDDFVLSPAPTAANGFTFEIGFTPSAADVAAGTTSQVWEIGGSSNGSGVYMVDGVPHFLSKMNGVPGNVVSGLNDTDWTGNAISVPLTSYPLIPDVPAYISGIFDLDSLTYSVNGSVSATATLANRGGVQENWHGDNTISIGADGLAGGPGGVTDTVAALFKDTDIMDLENGSDAVDYFSFWNGSDGSYALNIAEEALTATVTIVGWASASDGAISGGGLTDQGGGVYDLTGDVEVINAALVGLQFAPTGLTTYPVTINISIEDPDAASTTGNVVIDYSIIGGWRLANGLAPDGSEDLLDLDGDDLVNLLEFGFGTDAGFSDNVVLNPDGSVNGTPTTDLDFTPGLSFDALFNRRDDFGQSGSVSYTVQFSSDLMTFHNSTAPVTIVTDSSDDPDYHVASVPYPSILPDGKKARFYRVQVTEVP